ncbi:5' nucleotidase, NT5C type [Aureibacillus halotolerans]|nr:5'-3'-deoxyribonucleotidase [Aureibacillus halotolerans]
MKKRIAIDMDEVMADTGVRLMDLCNEFCNEEEPLTVTTLRGKRLAEIRPAFAEAIHTHLADTQFFRDLPVIEDSQRVIRKLHRHYDIFIATAAMEVPASFTAKYEWLEEHFPFLAKKNYVFCGDKSIIRADYLIDDNPRQLRSFQGEGLLYDAPHNDIETEFPRMNSWEDVERYFFE